MLFQFYYTPYLFLIVLVDFVFMTKLQFLKIIENFCNHLHDSYVSLLCIISKIVEFMYKSH